MKLIRLSIIALLGAILPLPVMADAISPNIDREEEVYSHEAPNAAFFGKGASGRMTEASYLRFTAEQSLLERRYKDAYRATSKAVQLDPGDPTGHVMLARSLSGMLRTKSGAIDEDLLNRTIKEWRLIAMHDVDLTEQLEAKANLKKLNKIAKAIKQQKMQLAKAKADGEGKMVATTKSASEDKPQ
ncbi:MAG: hypothetical protein IPP57_21355 [Candidatus Obscuribacter sp.]|jgi:predicted Zn-dependent protease|nr:hypothetical protein [Candidatus Obscuribacter sp.]MDQ5965673.1 hypothetical protein [Cyanobacteriota bacterium erpe_2018_sw_39hr_WHONDRS-SW48-000098_B_bin.30]MBK7836370.1 hypothetical protein [Candidatus Obscuribacter sp.]MBK9205850.1 hypothetical protein [Candidatus Obscuribacter sp.]MBK9617790.1 hypothetical protein [Candidatus Obscuribacter sp.]